MGAPKGRPKPIGSGRQKGTRNKTTLEVRAWARAIFQNPKVQEKTAQLAESGRLAPVIFNELLHYAYGKPKETVEIGAPRPLVLDVLTGQARDDAG